MRANDDNGRRSSERLSGYVAPHEKNYWDKEMTRISRIEGLHNAGMGTLMARISRFKIRLDLASLAEYAKIKPPPGEAAARK
jgi:hypothetical protein